MPLFYMVGGLIFTGAFQLFRRGVLVLPKLGHFSPEHKQTGSSGATESEF